MLDGNYLSAPKIDRLLEQYAANMRTTFENCFEPRFNQLAEGQQAILAAITPKSENKALRRDVDMLKVEVLSISKEIEELKRSQAMRKRTE